MPRHAESAAAGGASSARARDYAGYYGAPVDSAARERRLWWGPAILLWLALSAVGWAILFGIGWAVLQVF